MTFTPSEVRTVGQLSQNLHHDQEAFTATQAAHHGLLSVFAPATPEHLVAAKNALAWVARVHTGITDEVSEEQASAWLYPTIRSSELDAAVVDQNKATDELTIRFGLPLRSQLRNELATFAPGLTLLSDMIAVADRQIPQWHEFLNARRAADSVGMGPTVSTLVENTAPADDVPRAIKYAALASWVACAQKDDSRLNVYHHDQRNQHVDSFRELDEAFVRTRAAGIINTVAARRPRAIGGPAGVIKKQAQKKNRHLPIRDLLAKTHEVALTL